MTDGPWLTRNRQMNLSLRTFSDNWHAPAVVQHRTQAPIPAKPSPGDKGLTAEIAEERGAKNGGDRRYHGEVPDAAIRAPPISGPGLLESS
jgi:hypothetical protein